MIPVNVLTTIWKWEVDSLRRQVCARTPPPLRDEDAAKDFELGAPLPLKDARPGYVVLGLSDADDTHAVALGAASLTRDGPRDGGMAAGQRPRRPRGQILLLVLGGTGRPRKLAPGSLDPAGGDFPPSSVSTWPLGAQGSRCSTVTRRLEAGRSALRHLPHLCTYDRRERASTTLVTPLALHGLAIASVSEPDLQGLKTAVVRAIWGATRLSRPKRLSSRSFLRGTACPWPCTRRWPGSRKSPTSSPRLSGSRVAARPGGNRWGARSKRQTILLEPARGLVVVGRPGARAPATVLAGAPTLAPTSGPRQPSLPFLASA